jgi:hypothetical protein
MSRETNALSVVREPAKLRRARSVAPRIKRETDPAQAAWSRLLILEQASVLLAKHLLRQLKDGPPPDPERNI